MAPRPRERAPGLPLAPAGWSNGRMTDERRSFGKRVRSGLGRAVREAAGSEELRRLVGELADAVEGARVDLDRVRGHVGDLQRLADDLARDHRRAALHASVWSTMEWLRVAEVPEDVPISVILPTRNRSALLRRAVDSVLAQTYPRWELLVVVDGNEDDSPAVLASYDDARIHPLRGEGKGASAARNRGLERATGDVVAYLDDDNVMHPEWLRAVAWAFEERRPGTRVLYGARIVEERGVVDPEADRDLSSPLQLEAFDRARLRVGNYIDLGSIAHRRDHPEARFDEELAVLHDWDLILRLTAEEEPVVLPAVALLYGTGAPERLTSGDRKLGDLERMRRRGIIADDAAV